MRRIGNWLASNWYPIFLFVIAALILASFLWFELGSLVQGFNEKELMARSSSSTYMAIFNNPLGAPHKILQFIAQYFGQTSPLAMRSASAIIGMIIVGGFYYIMKNWYSRRVGVLTTLLFASSAWFLHVARSGTDAIIYTLLITAVASVVWLQKSNGGKAAVIISALTVLMLLYIPGMIWFVLPMVVWQIKRIGSLLEGQSVTTLSVVSLLAVLALSPLGFAFFQDAELFKTYLGLPSEIPTWQEALKGIAQVPIRLFIAGPDTPELWLGRLPLLSWFSSAMFVIGTYAYFFKRKLDRTWFIIYTLIIGMILVGLNGPVNISILLPFTHIMVAGGMALMLQQWFTVFPRNPVAKTLGAVLMTLAVITTSYYNIYQYYIAWPNNSETENIHQKY